jgi:hypothetical protein
VGPTCQTPHAAPGPRGSASLPRGCHVPRSSRTLKALSGPRAGVPTAPSRTRCPPASRRPLAVSPLAPSPRQRTSRPPRSEAASPGPSSCRPSHLAARPSPTCRAAVPAPVSHPSPRPSPVRRCRVVVGSPCSAAMRVVRALAPCTARCAGWLSWAARAAPAEANPGRARAVRLCRAKFRLSGTRIRFYIF